MRSANVLRAGLLVLLCGLPAWAQTEPPASGEQDPAEWVPADAVFYLGITDVAQMWADYQQTATYKLMQDEQLAKSLPSLGVYGRLGAKLKERLARVLDVQPDQLTNPFRGPLALYVEATPGETRPGLVASVGDAELMRRYYDAVLAKLKEHARHETETVGSATIDVLKSRPAEPGTSSGAAEEGEEDFPELAEPGMAMTPLGLLAAPEKMFEQWLDELFAPENMPETLALCLAEGRLIVAGSPDQAKAVLRRETRGRTLAETDDHKDLLRHLRPTGCVRLLVNIPRLIELARTAAGQADADELRTWLRILGAETLRSAVGHLRFGASSYDTKFELLFLMGSERSGLAKILSMANRPAAPPDTVGSDACLYAGVNLDVAGLLSEIERIVRQGDADAAEQFRKGLEAAEMPDGQTVNLRQEFFAHLRPPLSFVLTAGKPATAESVRILLAVAHGDQAAMARFFGHLAGLLQPREVRGTQVYDTVMPPGFCVAATSDRLLAGPSAGVEAALAPAAAEPLARTDGWKRAARFAPEEAWLTVYADSRRMMEAALDLARDREALMAGPAMMNPGLLILLSMLGDPMEPASDFDAASARKVLDHMGPGLFTIATTPQGVLLSQVSLKPEK